MRIRALAGWLLLALLLPALFYATALSGSCDYFSGDKSATSKPKAPKPPPGADAAAGQPSSIDTLHETLRADAARTDPAAGVPPPLSAALLGAEQSGAAKLIAADVLDFGLLADGRVLCRDTYGRLFTVSQTGADAKPWHSGWDAASAGWQELEGNEHDSECDSLSVSPDGHWVAVSHLVSTPASGTDAPARCNAVLLCSAAGGDGRLVALAEESDGGPQLDFTLDGSRLCCSSFIPGEPSAAHFAKLVTSSAEKGSAQGRYNTVAAADGTRSLQAAWGHAESYERCPISNNLAWQELDTPSWHFDSLAGGKELGKFKPSEAEGWTVNSEWVRPDAMLLSFAGKQQRLVFVDGHSKALPAGQYWRCFVSFKDGTCLFSRDGGTSIEFGKLDWSGPAVKSSTPRPELAAFAEPLEADSELPSVQHKWLALPDGSGALVRDHAYDALYLVHASR